MKFIRITEKPEIRKTLHAYMLKIEDQLASFIPVIKMIKGANWNDRIIVGGLSIEGSRPFGAATSENETIYTLTNSDSNYSLAIGSIKLSEIEHIEIITK